MEPAYEGVGLVVGDCWTQGSDDGVEAEEDEAPTKEVVMAEVPTTMKAMRQCAALISRRLEGFAGII